MTATPRKGGRQKGCEKTGGRVAGTPNKISGSVRENIAGVFNRLGGVQGMVDWAMANQTEFYRIYAKLLPIDVTLGGREGAPPVTIQIVKSPEPKESHADRTV